MLVVICLATCHFLAYVDPRVSSFDSKSFEALLKLIIISEARLCSACFMSNKVEISVNKNFKKKTL